MYQKLTHPSFTTLSNHYLLLHRFAKYNSLVENQTWGDVQSISNPSYASLLLMLCCIQVHSSPTKAPMYEAYCGCWESIFEITPHCVCLKTIPNPTTTTVLTWVLVTPLNTLHGTVSRSVRILVYQYYSILSFYILLGAWQWQMCCFWSHLLA